MILIIVAAIFAFFGFLGWKKGIIKIVVSIAAMVITLVATAIAAPIVSGAIIHSTNFDEKISDSIYQLLVNNSDIAMDEAVDIEIAPEELSGKEDAIREKINEIGNRYGLPKSVVNTLENVSSAEILNNVIKDGAATIKEVALRAFALRLAQIILNAIVYSVIFISVFIVLRIIVSATGLIGKLPVIHQANQLGGLAFGLLEGLITVWVFFIVLTAISHTEFAANALAEIGGNKILSLIYDNNLILKAILHAVAQIGV